MTGQRYIRRQYEAQRGQFLAYGSGYEEGTWTPTVVGESTPGTTTYVTQAGTYTRIGRQVVAVGRVSWSAASGVGILVVGGLPYVSDDIAVCAVWAANIGVSDPPLLLRLGTGITDLVLEESPSGTPVGIQIGANPVGELQFVLTYFTT